MDYSICNYFSFLPNSFFFFFFSSPSLKICSRPSTCCRPSERQAERFFPTPPRLPSIRSFNFPLAYCLDSLSLHLSQYVRAERCLDKATGCAHTHSHRLPPPVACSPSVWLCVQISQGIRLPCLNCACCEKSLSLLFYFPRLCFLCAWRLFLATQSPRPLSTQTLGRPLRCPDTE